MFHLSNRVRDPGQHREPVRGVADRKLEHVGEGPRAVPLEDEQPGAERTWDDGREQSGARNEVDAARAEGVDRRGPRRRPLPAHDHDLVAVGVVKDRGQVAAGPVQVGLDDLEREARSHRGVEGVPAAFEHRHPRRRRKPVGGRDHPERPAQLRSCRELHAARL